MANEMCMIMTSRGEPIAEGMMERAGGGLLRVTVPADEVELVAEQEIVEIVGMGEDNAAWQCMLLEQDGYVVVLCVLMKLDASLRKNIRVSTSFESFLHPISGVWKGRREFTAVDISCGGLAFYSTNGIEEGERVEVVIPVTSDPLLLQMEILGRQELKNDRSFYKAKFVDVHHDHECMLREAVFSIQLENHARKTAKEIRQ